MLSSKRCPASEKWGVGGGGGAQPPPLANTVLASWVWKGLACFQAQCSHHGFGRASHALKRATPGLKKKKAGGLGGAQPPPISKHSARIMGLEGFECFQASVVRLQKSGGLGGAQPPPFANTVLASWVWKGLACFQAQCSHHGFGRASHALKRATPGLKKKKSGGVGGGAAPPISKHSARIMGLEGFECFPASVVRLQKSGGLGGGAQPPPFANTVLASWVWKGLACFQAQCSHHGFGRASHALKRVLPGLKKKAVCQPGQRQHS